MSKFYVFKATFPPFSQQNTPTLPKAPTKQAIKSTKTEQKRIKPNPGDHKTEWESATNGIFPDLWPVNGVNTY